MSKPKRNHGRTQNAYNKKVRQITKWYEHLQKERANPTGNNLVNPNTKQEPKRAELKSLDYYINQLRKPVSGRGND